jgi:SAM-dependent methyltransferase
VGSRDLTQTAPDGQLVECQQYTSRYYRRYSRGSRRSAEVILPRVFDLVGPTSVVDVGCGTGAWLAVARELGVEDVYGIDAWVNEAELQIPAERFARRDLREPIDLGRTFDLAISVEVAEHLPEAKASALTESLTRLAPVILFSAAVPGQGGTDHVNEQWPQYWAALFRKNGFVAVDCLRRALWFDERLEPWYAQNLIVYSERGRATRLERPVNTFDGSDAPLPLVHPGTLEIAALHRFPDPDAVGLRSALRFTMHVASSAVRRRFR